MRKALAIGMALALAGIAGGASAQTTVVSTNVVANTSWSGTIILQQPIFVTSGAILTIQAGTTVRGQPRSSAPLAGQTAGTPGALIVTQDGRINAVGAPTSAGVIVMTTAAVDNDNDGNADDVDMNGFEDRWTAGLDLLPGTADDDLFLDDTPRTQPLAPLNCAGTGNVALWGGIALLGRAPTNLAAVSGVGYGQATIEGLTFPGFPAALATYGGTLPHDNSGTLRYVSVRHAGDEIGNSNELNGISLAGVGDGTKIEYVEVYANFDDGIEEFGGTVNGRYQHVAFVGDDMYDVDEGYTGVKQFLFGIQTYFNQDDTLAYGSTSGDRACEFDGDNYETSSPVALPSEANVSVRQDVTGNGPAAPLAEDPTPGPLSGSAFYNMTLIGAIPDAPAFAPPTSAVPNAASGKRGCVFRNGYVGDVHNSIIVNTGLETGIEVDTTAAIPEAAPGFEAQANAIAGLINLVCSTTDDGAAPAAQETNVINAGNALNLALGGTAAGANVINGAFSSLAQEDVTFALRGNASCKLDPSLKPNAVGTGSPINPRPGSGVIGQLGCVAPQGPNLDPSATYRGAFNKSAPELWTTGWTALNIAGLLAD